MKKLLSALVVAGFLFSLGCGETAKKDEKKPAPTTGGGAGAPAKDKDKDK